MGSLLNLHGGGIMRYYKYPSSITLSGDLLQYETNIAQGEDAYVYTLAYDTNNFNAPIRSVVWDVIAPNGVATIESQTNTQCNLRISTVTSEYVKITVTVTVTFATNKQMSTNIVIGVQLPGYPVDLGLPSGLLWRNMNLGAANPIGYGDYFAFGETEGYANAAARNAAMDAKFPEDAPFEGGFDSTSYTKTGASAISTDLTLAQDAARVILQNDYRMPSKAECEELINNCTWTWKTVHGVSGWSVEGNGSRIFLVQGGYYSGMSLTPYGRYRSTGRNGDTGSWYISFKYQIVLISSYSLRNSGLNIRPVQGGITVTFRTWSDNEHTVPAAAVLQVTLPGGVVETVNTVNGVGTVMSTNGNATVTSIENTIDVNSFTVSGDTVVDIVVS